MHIYANFITDSSESIIVAYCNIRSILHACIYVIRYPIGDFLCFFPDKMKIFVMRRRTVVGRALLQVLVWSLVYNWMSILPSEGFDAISIISPLQSLIPAWPFSYSICISGRRLSSTCRGDICVGAAGLDEPCYCTYVCVFVTCRKRDCVAFSSQNWRLVGRSPKALDASTSGSGATAVYRPPTRR